MLNVIAYAFGCYLGMYINVFFYSNMLKTKYKDASLALIYVFLNMIHIVLSDYVFKSYLFKYIEYFIVSFGFLMIFFEGKTIKKILVYCEMNAIILFTELISCQIVFGALGITADGMREMSVLRILVMVICNIGCGFFAIIILHLQKKVKFTLSTQKLKYILACFGIQIVACSLYNVFMLYTHTKINQFFVIYVAVSVFMDIYLLNVMAKMEIKEETEQKIIYFQKQELINAEYYVELADRVNHLVELRSNYEGELRSVYQTIGKEYAHHEQKEEENQSADKEQKNILVENIISGVKQRLDYQGISYYFDFSIPKDVPIQVLDLSSILSNLFDNAIEAIVKWKESNLGLNGPEFVARAEVNDQNLQIIVENRKNPNEKIKKLGENYITSKSDQQVHGYGMKIIGRIVDKYEGTMEVSYTDTWFKNCITIPLLGSV